MNEATFLQIIHKAFTIELAHAQILLLQTAGIIGIVAILLIVRGHAVLSEGRSYVLGVVFGCANFLLAFMVEQWMQGPTKPYLRNDLLFLSGFFGGWQNASITILCSCLGRFFFGSSQDLMVSSVDTIVIGYSGIFIRSLLKKINIQNISFANVILISTLKFLASLPVAIFMYISNNIPASLFYSISARRFIATFSFSIIIMHTITIILRKEIERENQFYLDSLSGLPNRRALKSTIDQNFSKWEDEKKTQNNIYILVSINNFSELICEYNHDWFDEFFKQFSKKISQLCLNEPYVKYLPWTYCFSDHSFVIVLSEIDIVEEQEKRIARSIYTELQLILGQKNLPLKVLISLSIIEPLFNRMFSSSWFLQSLSLMEKGWHDSVQYFEPTIIDQIKLESRLRALIEQWIAEGEVPLWLQPKMQLIDGSCIGAEALMRAFDPSDGTRSISPFLMLSVAAKHQLSLGLEWACIRTVLKQLQQLPISMSHLKISVNLSALSLMQPDFGEKLCALLSKKNIAKNRLIIEITETNELTVSEAVKNNIAQIFKHGVGLSLDDFGTGYSSLLLLSSLPISELKLDYAMISNIENPRFYSTITLSSGAAKDNSAYIVAEGIETEKQRELLQEIDIKIGQGFLFSKAVPFADFVTYASLHARGIKKSDPPKIAKCT